MENYEIDVKNATCADMKHTNIGAKFALHQKDVHTANPRKASALNVIHVHIMRSSQIVCNATNVNTINTEIDVPYVFLGCIVNMENGLQIVISAIHAFTGKTKITAQYAQHTNVLMER